MSDAATTPADPTAPSGERRQVTALFADMVGFTAISERLGEEGTFALIHPIYELMTRAVREQGGSVKDFTGDGIMALFGVPDALEDGPLRACRAALSIHERLAAAAPAIEAKHGVRPQMRIGINSGLRGGHANSWRKRPADGIGRHCKPRLPIADLGRAGNRLFERNDAAPRPRSGRDDLRWATTRSRARPSRRKSIGLTPSV